MSGVDTEGLPEGWEALSRADASALAPPDGAKDRVRLQLAATLGVAAGLGAAGAMAAAAAGAAASPAPAPGVVGAVLQAFLLKKVLVLAVVAATAVTGGTAAYVQVRAEKRETARRMLAPSTAAPVSSAPVQQATPAVTAAVEPAPPVPSDTLGQEHTLLDEARLAISQGRLVEAQAFLATHARNFPSGRLSEEREALDIRLLVRQGHVREASRRAARFRAAHPHSIQQPGIDAALRSARR